MGTVTHKKAAKPAKSKKPNDMLSAAIADKLPQPLDFDFHFQGGINDDSQAKLDLKLFWRLILETPGVPLKHKIEAAKDYGKSLAMFTENINERKQFVDENGQPIRPNFNLVFKQKEI